MDQVNSFLTRQIIGLHWIGPRVDGVTTSWAHDLVLQKGLVQALPMAVPRESADLQDGLAARDELTDDRSAGGDLAGQQQAAAGLGVGQQQQLVLGDVG